MGTWGWGVSVIAELKRRNVVRVAVLYGLAAWLILQVADVLVPALGLPVWVMRFVALLLILGFPLVLIFSWVYELTPEGLKKQHEVDLNQSITHETGRKINYLIGALAVLAIVVVAVERFIPRTAPIPAATDAASGAPSAEAPVQAAAKSIAVLPFADMSSGKDQEYFADGLSEELLNLLAKLPELRVIGRTSSFQFKGRERRPAGDRREAQRRAHPGGQRAQVRREGADHGAAHQGRGRLLTSGRRPTTARSTTSSPCRTTLLARWSRR